MTIGRHRTLEEIERDAILDCLLETGDPLETARILGVGKTTIYRKLKMYGVSIKTLDTIIRPLAKEEV